MGRLYVCLQIGQGALYLVSSESTSRSRIMVFITRCLRPGGGKRCPGCTSTASGGGDEKGLAIRFRAFPGRHPTGMSGGGVNGFDLIIGSGFHLSPPLAIPRRPVPGASGSDRLRSDPMTLTRLNLRGGIARYGRIRLSPDRIRS